MILLYISLVIVLAALAWVTNARTDSLGKRYNMMAAELRSKVEGSKPDNDPYKTLELQGDLVELARRKRAIEDKHGSWLSWAEWLTRKRDALWGWRGRTAPYIVGITDALGLLAALEAYGLADQVRWATVAKIIHQWYVVATF